VSTDVSVKKWKEYMGYIESEHLEAEVLKLPVRNLAVEYLVRFTKPVATVLQEKPIRVFNDFLSKKPFKECLDEEVLKRWKDMILESNDNASQKLNKKQEEFINSLLSLDKVIVHELELKRKDVE